MATLQKRKSRGHNYWSIVESRRVNGKPRPVILEYLGSAATLLERLKEGIPKKVHSYSHGLGAIMLDIAEELQVVPSINRQIKSKQLRNGFTVGGSLLLAAIGRVGKPTSKRGWYEGWARYTSLSYLLRMSLNKLDSQHFWDQMEAFPLAAIHQVEEDILKVLIEKEGITLDTLLYDTSNFFTYIDSNNQRCSLAQRGRNKQKRMDLRQFGLLLLVSRDQIPLFHQVYQGNLSDKGVFKDNLQKILARFKSIAGSLENITLIFDQGNNSKEILKDVDKNIHFIGALSPYQHKDLIKEANNNLNIISVNDYELECYRLRTRIWELDLTCVVYISEKLRKGQIKGLKQDIKKIFAKLRKLKEKIQQPTIEPLKEDAFDLDFWVDKKEFDLLNHKFGRRILITNQHDWSTKEIILAYWGQSKIESVFKRIKNPFHLALRPQYHWTDQKIEVHGFICLLALLLVMVASKRAREKVGFTGTPDVLLEKLSAIRLTTFIENPLQKTKGRYKTVYRLEEMDPDIQALAEGMGLSELKLKTKIPFSVYN
ncbi:MAG: transposase [Candidatus Altiarchaeales archaeon HGW-Altiarchaeales-2]|nr:MAG: transposase [Candidatus Altiarchaeales archaeon HGW-Altiarchaeales-2]